MDPRSPVRKGDPVKLAAAQVNALNDMMREPRPGAEPVSRVERPYTWVYALNDSNVDFIAGRPAQIIGLVQDTTTAGGMAAYRESPVLRVTQFSRNLNRGSSTGATGITVEPIRAGKIGRIAIGGVVQARVLIDNLSHSCALVTDQSPNVLTSADSGDYALIYRPSASDSDIVGEVAECVVRLGHVSTPGVYAWFGHEPWSRNTTQLCTRESDSSAISVFNWLHDIPAGYTTDFRRCFVFPVPYYNSSMTEGRYSLVAWGC